MLNEDQRQLVTDNLNLVYWIANKLGYKDEDSIQYGMLGLCLAAERYDSSKGVLFSTFAYSYIAGWLQGTYSDIKYKQKIDSNVYVDIQDFESIIPERNDSAKEECYEVIESANPKLRKVLMMILYGYTRKEIADKLNISESTISRWIHEFRKEYNNGK